MWAKQTRQHGFTIVELLIVIVVIGILAAITIVSFNGISQKAENAKTVSSVSAAIKLMQSYKALNGNYPAPLDSSARETYPCIGSYPNDTCASINNVDASGTGIAYVSTNFNAKLQTVGSIPQPSTQLITVGGQQVRGSFASLTTNQPSVIWFLKGNGIDCGISGANKDYDSNGGTRCYFVLP